MRIIRSRQSDAAWNLAAEEYLFSKAGLACLFLYVNAPSVVIGCNQILQSEVDEAFCRKMNIAVVRRMSGGGAVYHDRGNLNFSFIQDREEGQALMDGSFLQVVVSVLKTIGLNVSMGARKDLWIGGHKISGTASHIAKERSLHHGTLLYDTNLENLSNALPVHRMASGNNVQSGSGRGIRSVPSPVANVRTYTPDNPEADVFFDEITQAFSRYYRQNIATFAPEEIRDIQEIYHQKYLSNTWIYRK